MPSDFKPSPMANHTLAYSLILQPRNAVNGTLVHARACYEIDRPINYIDYNVSIVL